MLYNKLKEEAPEYGNFIESNFLCYPDDCFIIWPSSKWKVEKFVEQLRNLHSNIKFTFGSSTSNIPFLDIMVMANHNKVLTDIYYKIIDTHQYLHFNSCHKLNITYHNYAQALL